MPGRSGLELLQAVLRDHPGTDFVLVTANSSVASAVEALRMGATDYLEKPVRAEDLILALERALGRRRLFTENRRLRDELALYQSCRLLSGCLEPEDLFAMGLDLSLRGLELPARLRALPPRRAARLRRLPRARPGGGGRAGAARGAAREAARPARRRAQPRDAAASCTSCCTASASRRASCS